LTTPYTHHHLFEINDNLKLVKNKLGPYEYISIDDFYKRPEDIHQMLEDSWVPNWKINSQGRNYKDYFDCRSAIQLDLNNGFEKEYKTMNFLKKALNIQEYSCSEIALNIFTWINTPEKNIQFLPHQDNNLNVIIYLDKINSGGTALYSQKRKDNPSEELDIQYNIDDIKKNIQVIPSKFNKCVIFNGNIPHGGFIKDHSKYSNGNWRYNAVYFFDKWQN